jgi:O-antigen biosynthesis protein
VRKIVYVNVICISTPPRATRSLVTFRYGRDLPNLVASWAPFSIEVVRFNDRWHGLVAEFMDVIVCVKPLRRGGTRSGPRMNRPDVLVSRSCGAALRSVPRREYLFDLCDLLGFKRPRISVVVPNYNYARYLRQRLTSFRAQTCPILDVIMLDDASTDDSLAVLDELAREMQELRVVRNDRNGGSAIKQWARSGRSKGRSCLDRGGG